jgi:hypothetical protein
MLLHATRLNADRIDSLAALSRRNHLHVMTGECWALQPQQAGNEAQAA